MTTVFIVDDHPLVADGVATMLNKVEDVSVLGSVKSGKEAIDFLNNHQPDILLLDINLPDIDGIALCENIKSNHTNIKIIMLTSVNDAAFVSESLSKGANGYLLKDMERNELVIAIQTVMNGKAYISTSVNEKLLASYKSFGKIEVASKVVITRREKEILNLLEKGMNGPQIAEELFISTYTVETHRKNLMQKLETSTTQMLLKKAREMNFIPN